MAGSWLDGILQQAFQAYNTIQESGASFAQRTNLNFVGGAVVTDDSANNRTNVSLTVVIPVVPDVITYATGVHTITPSQTIGTAGTQYVFQPGAIIHVPAGVDLIIRGTWPTVAPNQQIFSVDTGGTLSTPDLPASNPAAWWGCLVGGSSYDNAPPLLSAILSAPGRELTFDPGVYSFLTSMSYVIGATEFGTDTFYEAPKFRGSGRDRTTFDCRFAGVNFEFDTSLVMTAKFLRGLAFRGIRISGELSTPANAYGIKIRHCYYSTFEDCQIDTFTKSGLWILCTEGDKDGCVHTRLVEVQIQSCALWGIDVDVAANFNEVSYLNMTNVTVASCGTADSSALLTRPVSGGMRWNGQVVGGDEVAFSTCNECCMLIYQGVTGALGNTGDFGKITFENAHKRDVWIAGINDMHFAEVQVYHNDQFRAGLGIYADDSGINLVRNLTVDRCFFRPSDGLQTGTFDHTTGLWSIASHGFAVGDRVETFNSGGALPNAFTAATTYYVIASGFTANAFKLSATSGGSALTGSTDGTGTNSVCWRFFAFDSASGGNLQRPIVWSPSWYLATGVTTGNGLGVRYGAGFALGDASLPISNDGGTLSVPALAATTAALTSSLSVGSPVAAAGSIRVANAVTALASRKADNSADVPLVSIDSSNNLIFGGTAAAYIDYTAGATGHHRLNFGSSLGLDIYDVSGKTYIDGGSRDTRLLGSLVVLQPTNGVFLDGTSTNIRPGGFTAATFDTSGGVARVALYGGTPVAQQTDPGTLTNLIGGAASLTLLDITAGAAVDGSSVNQNFKDVATFANALRTILHNLGGTT